MILVIDNYDSFTYNLVQYLSELGAEIIVKRNDEVSLDEISKLKPQKIVISPGPCTPKEAGISMPLIHRFKGEFPILGVCLGHQSIGEVMGGKVIRAPKPMHGKISQVSHSSKGIFSGVENPFEATRYHSLIIERETCPSTLSITAWTTDGMIMGIESEQLKLFGVQFHPESIMTKEGKKILKNFLSLN
ncbi:MAG: aminodeoxychorismate/anthranilate synthase component II [Chloroherpetonaceae bacterium]|nr:aminodeoxychorismate/anthranilate synthase component II [Chloroherpetonaceae bacterium]